MPWFDRKTKNKSKLKMDFTGNTEDLRTVYELCEPNHEGLISLRKLQELFQSHSSSASPSSEDFFTDQWINFDEFCQGVASFYSPTTVMMMSQSQPPLPRGR